MTDHNELRNLVVAKLFDVAGTADWGTMWEEMADAVIDIVLEGAAKVAFSHGIDDDDLDDFLSGYNSAVTNIAAAIRALKEQTND